MSKTGPLCTGHPLSEAAPRDSFGDSWGNERCRDRSAVRRPMTSVQLLALVRRQFKICLAQIHERRASASRPPWRLVELLIRDNHHHQTHAPFNGKNLKTASRKRRLIRGPTKDARTRSVARAGTSIDARLMRAKLESDGCGSTEMRSRIGIDGFVPNPTRRRESLELVPPSVMICLCPRRDSNARPQD
jgi:hypothetical protein